MILQSFLDAQESAQFTTIDDLLATLEAEERSDVCEFEAECYRSRGIKAWRKKRGVTVRVYRCGWIGMGTVYACSRRKQYLGGSIERIERP